MKKSVIYPVDAWLIRETQFMPQYHYRGESVFALGNGFIGMRGAFEEGFNNDNIPCVDGTYLNGFYESEPIKYPEPGYGYAKNSQTMLNVTNAKIIRVLLNDEPFHLDTGEVLDYERILDLQTGILTRRAHWRSPSGCELRLEVRRLVSFAHKHLAAIEYTITPLHNDMRLTLLSQVNGDVVNQSTQKDPRFGSALQGRVLKVEEIVARGEYAAIRQRTGHSQMGLVCAVDNDLTTDCPHAVDVRRMRNAAGEEIGIEMIYKVQATADQPVTLRKYISYVTTQDTPEDKLIERAEAVVKEAKANGFEPLVEAQTAFVQRFWAGAEVTIEGDDALQQGIRFNMFHLLQAAGKDGATNVGAKGLTGEGYEGHYFWDTEMFVVPFFMYVDPAISRSLMEYRYSILDKARARARELSHTKGAAYPWRTINGEEASSFFLAGTAQYHINADIAYGIKAYVEASGDTDFLVEKGAEILFETARLWADLGDYVPSRGNQFCIHGVTGPDEYTTLVDNNCYTNLMAQLNLQYAAQVAEWMERTHPDDYMRLSRKLNLTKQERADWQEAADKMYIPYDPDSGLYPADDSFFNRASWRWDWGTRDGLPPLLNRYHYLVVYRHQVCKQADLVLALVLLGDRFTREEKRRNFNYYEQITTHDSSLSTCTFSILASEIGYHRRAYEYFLKTARMDLDDYHGNVTHGVHIAAMAGTWMCLVNGFAGLRMEPGADIGEGIPHYRPYLPDDLKGYSFKVRHGDATIKVTVAPREVVYELVEGGDVTLLHYDMQVVLNAQQPRWVFTGVA